MRDWIAFHDDLGALSPLDDLRASFDIRTGARTTLERWGELLDSRPTALLAPARLAAITSERHDVPVNSGWSASGEGEATPVTGAGGSMYVVNGRCAVPPRETASLSVGDALIESESAHLIVARVRPGDLARLMVGPRDGLRAIALPGRHLLSRPWHVRSFRDSALRHDLDAMTADVSAGRDASSMPGVTLVPGGAIFVHPSATISPTAVLDAEGGPIVIDEHAVVRPGAIVIGPVYVGPHASVLERALIRPNTSIGPYCKVAGEVGGVIFQGYSNKAHDGYLGDSWVGEWVNFGAGTTNSNLLNTYDQVIARASPGGPNERTGEQFLGAIVGDHVKFAIMSRLMTGSVLHTGSMFAQSAAVSGCVPSFTWATDAGAKPYRFEKFMEVARAAMGRRKIEPSEAYLKRLRDICLGRSGTDVQ
jgi:UDP-N-acetylglucosamine diphosphorylase / glucose-1-phosphate thymidylyltransferase / UDP-N-acetylgalactosamine diphosphorylase / glucosamine-1-phosphate N-acetyltransferase / galactosamine-1-phosphate N-acetyltransferase